MWQCGWSRDVSCGEGPRNACTEVLSEPPHGFLRRWEVLRLTRFGGSSELNMFIVMQNYGTKEGVVDTAMPHLIIVSLRHPNASRAFCQCCKRKLSYLLQHWTVPEVYASLSSFVTNHGDLDWS